MAIKLNRLSAKTVSAARGPALMADGGGLYLRVSGSDAKSWVFIHRVGSKRSENGLGSLTAVPLARARAIAVECRAAVADGKSPKLALAGSKAVPTFGELADAYVNDMSSKWKNEKHVDQWRMTLTEYAKPLRSLPVDEVGVDHILSCLKPHWDERPETANRLRGRIERVLNAAKAAGHREGENPAAWRGHLDNLLPSRAKLSRGHHPALPFAEMPEFIANLRNREGVAALALEFLILTACRSGEVRGANWNEIDLEAKVWTIPAARMKGGRLHRMPLTDRALEILTLVRPLKRIDGLVFPGIKQGSALSDMTLAAVLRRMQIPQATASPHGFRSSFKDWATETTSFPNELSEAALAHISGDATERAYRRGDQFLRRRELMEAWGKFCESQTQTNAVTLSLSR